jgi:Ca2+-binding RTX toxin-like protein
VLGQSGNDDLDGSAGVDTVSYAGAGSAVRVDLRITGAQVTGGAGSDTLAGFENLVGSSSGDVLTGDGSPNRLSGGDGDDRLLGLAGYDTLIGGPGRDACDLGPDGGTSTECEA